MTTHFTEDATLSEAEADRLDIERIREILLRQGRTEAEVDKLLSNGEHKE